MGEPVSRFLYRCLLRLHPEAFRREFADEMLWIFDELTARKSSVPLVVDAAASLARQWILGMPWRKRPLRETVRAAAAAGSFAWQHIEVPEPRLPLFRMMQGGAVALALFSALSFAAFRPVPRLAASSRGSGGVRGAAQQDWWGAFAASASGAKGSSVVRDGRQVARLSDSDYYPLSAPGKNTVGEPATLVLE